MFAALDRYELRNPVSLARLRWEPGSETATYLPQTGHDGEQAETLDALDFVARLLAHVPNPRRHLVHYYGAYSNVETQVTNLDMHLSNVDTHVSTEFSALDAHLSALLASVSNQVSIVQSSLDQANQRLLVLMAGEKEIMKLDLTPDGQRKIVPSILTCMGSNCPDVLQSCPGGACFWNNVGPLP
jgi:hypothetical protein